MKFYVDENLSPEIAVQLRGLGFDATHTYEHRRAGASDEDQLEFAARNGYCIVTADQMDFLELTRRFKAAARPHAGAIIVGWPVRRAEVVKVAAMIAELAGGYPAGMEPYTMARLVRPTRS